MPRDAFTLFSALTKEGRDEIWERIEDALALGVITSYSIHYTKLYEVRNAGMWLAILEEARNVAGYDVVSDKPMKGFKCLNRRFGKSLA